MGTALDPLYQTQLRGVESYRFDVPDGNYRLTLLFAELVRASQADRSFVSSSTAGRWPRMSIWPRATESTGRVDQLRRMLGRRAGHPCRFSCPPGRGRSQRNHVEKSLLAGRVRESARIRACRSSGNRTDEGVRPCLAEVACVGTIVFPVRIVWRLLPRRQRMNRIVRGRDGSMPLPESGRFACRKADLSR